MLQGLLLTDQVIPYVILYSMNVLMEEKWQISYQKFLVNKNCGKFLFVCFSCHKILLKFGELPVIRQICQGFSAKIALYSTIYCKVVNFDKTTLTDMYEANLERIKSQFYLKTKTHNRFVQMVL